MKFKDYYCYYDSFREVKRWTIYKDNTKGKGDALAYFENREEAILFILKERLTARIFFTDYVGVLAGFVRYNKNNSVDILIYGDRDGSKQVELSKTLFIMPDGQLRFDFARDHFLLNKVKCEILADIKVYDRRIPDKDFDGSVDEPNISIRHTVEGPLYSKTTEYPVVSGNSSIIVNIADDSDVYKLNVVDKNGKVKSKHVSDEIFYNNNPRKDEVANQTTGIIDVSELEKNDGKKKSRKHKALKAVLITIAVILLIAAIAAIVFYALYASNTFNIIDWLNVDLPKLFKK